jgi:tetratricopeptide (TPR) repeat protein
VAGEGRRAEQGPWALHGAGWTALAMGNLEGARQTFSDLLGAAVPPQIDAWARHGLGLSLYGLGRYADAVKVWETLRAGTVPAVIERDVAFWYGDAVGRVGDAARADATLLAFTQGGPHPLLESGLVRRGWWALGANHFADSAAAFRSYLTSRARGGADRDDSLVRGAPRPRGERDWADAGLTLALLGANDWPGAQTAAAALEARRSELVQPVLVRMVEAAVAVKRSADAQALIERMLGGTLTPPVRGWLLFEKGQSFSAEGNRDDARTQYELARDADPGSETSHVAAYSLSQTDFDLREYAQVVGDLGVLLSAPLDTDLRAAALLLQGEAAYQASDLATAATTFRRFLTEYPSHERVRVVRLALAWTALRQGQADDALRQFLEFARAYPDHANAVDALQLASELTLASGDLTQGRQILDELVTKYGASARGDFARLNRAILLLREGQAPTALPALREWVTRAAGSPLIGRAHAALGAALLSVGAPADAQKEFARAQAEGVGALAMLGTGTVALAQDKVADATKALTEARDNGTADVAAAAEYGLAVAKFKSGAIADFKPIAQAALDANPTAPSAARLLYVLTGIAVEERDWPGALATAKRLVGTFGSDDVADDSLHRVADGAATAQAWPVAYEAFSLLRQRYPSSPFAQASVPFAEAQINAGHAPEAIGTLEQAVAAAPTDARAWLVLARAREATGDRQGAQDGYLRASRESQGPEVGQALLGHARLLAADNRSDQARAVLQRLVKSDDTRIVMEASDIIGDTYVRDGDHLAATEYYMTAAYLDPSSPLGRRGLLGAGQSFAALNQRDAAAIVYNKLLAQPDVPADVAAAARQGLAAAGGPR